MDRKTICSDALRRRILNLELAPGASIDETETSEEFGLSRTPVREVLQMLIREGYWYRETNRGTTVSPMNIETMRSFFQTAPLIYATIARLGAENGLTRDLAELKLAQRDFRKAVRAQDAPYLQPALDRLLIDHTRMSHRFYRPRQSEACRG
ncbi:MAG: GntR family transcriptional regulator [Hyphomicrobiaceae bacterium]